MKRLALWFFKRTYAEELCELEFLLQREREYALYLPLADKEVIDECIDAAYQTLDMLQLRVAR